MDAFIYLKETIHFAESLSFIFLSVIMLAVFLTDKMPSAIGGSKSVSLILYCILQGLAVLFGIYSVTNPEMPILDYLQYFTSFAAFSVLTIFSLQMLNVSAGFLSVMPLLQFLLAGTIAVLQGSADLIIPFLLTGFPALTIASIALGRTAYLARTPADRMFFRCMTANQIIMLCLALTQAIFFYLDDMRQSEGATFWLRICVVLSNSIFMFLFFQCMRNPVTTPFSRTIGLFSAIWLSLATLLVAMPGVFCYFAWNRAYEKAVNSTAGELFMKINNELEQFHDIVTKLSAQPILMNFLENPSPENLNQVNTLLDRNAFLLQRGTIFLMNSEGKCVASSNSMLLDSDFRFRGYFRPAMENGSACTAGISIYNHKPSFYMASRIESGNDVPIGVVAVRFTPFFMNNSPMHACAFTSPDRQVRYASDESWIGMTEAGYSPQKLQLRNRVAGRQDLLVPGQLNNPYDTTIYTRNRFNTFIPGWNMYLAISTRYPWQMHALALRLIASCLILAFSVWLCVKLYWARQVREEDFQNWQDSFFLSSPEPCIILDNTFRILDVNYAMADMLGYTQRAILLMELGHIFATKDDLLHFQTASVNLVLSKSIRNYRAILRKNNTRTIICTASGILLQSRNPNIQAAYSKSDFFVWFFNDETALIRQLDALKESEELYRSLAKSSPDHMFMLDNSGVFLSSNDPRIASQIEKQKNHPSLSTYFTPETVIFYKTMIENVFVMQKPLTFQHSIKLYDTEKFYMDTLYPIMKNGRVTAVGGMSRDITAIKKIEESLKKSELRFKDINSASNDIVWETNSDGKISFCSDNMKSKLGFTIQEVLGTDPMAFLAEEQRLNIYRLMFRSIRSHTPFKISTSIRKKDPAAEFMPIFMTCIPLYDDFNKCCGIRGICTDITMYKELEDKLSPDALQKLRVIAAVPSTSKPG